MKEALRAEARKIRDKLIDPQKGLQLRDNFLKNIELPEEAIISAYWPIGSEIDVRPLMKALYEKGYKVCLPCIVAENAPLVFREWEPEAVMMKSTKSNFKIYEPCPQHHEELTPTILIAPLLAFDKSRHRLGYGGGYYDRTIIHLRSSAAQESFPASMASPSRVALGSIASHKVARTESRQRGADAAAPSEERSDARGAINKLITIGCAYSEQETEKIPNEDWDVQLDKIITESKVYA